MVKRKTGEADLADGDKTVPIAIQNFLWRQTSPFIRPKLGKLCDASCVSFERVLAQNILHGLSPSLCEAIQNISRWKFIQAAFPHLMHCCAAALRERKNVDSEAKFTSNETKLLYTLHWVILDAASECEDIEIEQGLGRSFYSYLHSLDTIQLFVYLFAPLIDTMKESDFQSLKLENGLRLWQPLWEHRQPDVPCFSTPVKAKRVVLKAQRNLMKVNFNLANIYIGKGTSTDNIYLGPDDMVPSPGGSCEASTPRAPLARLSDICALSTTATETSVEIVCEVCSDTIQNKDGEMVCKCGVRRTSFNSLAERKSICLPPGLSSPVDKDYINKRLESVAGMGHRSSNPDVLSASYFDVAVMRCLFCPQWVEEGCYWGLRYIHQRLLEISDELNRVEYQRERSRSLPIPDIHITPPLEAPPSTPTSPKHDIIDQQEVALKLFNKDHHEKEHKKEPAFKRMRVSEFKHLIGDRVKMLCRRESTEQFDLDSLGKVSKDEASSGRSSPDALTSNDEEVSRPRSALGKLQETDNADEDDLDGYQSSLDILRRKSMPALKHHKVSIVKEKEEREGEEEDDEDSSGSGSGSTDGNKDGVTRTLSLKPELLQKPIITITQDSPDPSIAGSSWFQSKRESLVSDKSEDDRRPFSLPRSYTDSNICYSRGDEMEEVPGSVHYIQSNGQLNYGVILLAVHSMAGRQPSSRICGILFSILNCLLDLGIIKKEKKKKQEKDKEDSSTSTDQGKDDDKGKKTDEPEIKPKDSSKIKDKTYHTIAMETLIRIYKVIGCPHGCGDGYRGVSGDHLRSQGVHCLTRLMNINKTQFKKFLQGSLMKQPLQDIMDFLHALMGFCIDPALPTSPLGQGSKKSGSKDSQTGYGNNFGELSGGGPTVQGQIMVLIFKPLLSKFVENKKDLNNHENVGLYCDIRQFVNFMKEVHGGTFRKVALSCLLEKLIIEPVYAKEPPTLHKMSKSVRPSLAMHRRNMSITSESGEERLFREAIAAVAASMASDESSGRGSRRSIFRRRTKKQILPPHGAISDPEVFDDFPPRLSPRVSMSAAEDDPSSGPSTPKRKFSKFGLAWRRAAKSDHEDDSASESPALDTRRQAPDPTHIQLTKGQGHGLQSPVQGELQGHGQVRQKKMSFKAAGQATLTFLTARKRIEDGLKNWGKRRASKRGSIDEGENSDSSHHGSHDVLGERTERVLIREKKLVQSYALKSGLLRFNFMLDCCQPGALPDPHLIAALLDLEAPVIGRACLLLECAHFVHRCNKGDWPTWMKLNLPGFRQVGLLPSRGQPSGQRRNIMLQRMAGMLFHQWGEALANHLYDIMNEDGEDKFSILHQVKDESKKKELRIEDEEENFMDEATVNHTGSDCPYALRMIACQLLLEITTFLRETYQYLPRSKLPQRVNTWDKPSSRRWSTALSSPGHSERSNSRSSQGEASHLAGSPGERKISFAVFGQAERSDSINSSTTTISQMDLASGDSKGRQMSSSGNQKLLKTRRGSTHNSSFRNQRSFKIKRPEGGGSIKRLGSIKGRKVSTQSLQSTVSFEDGESQLKEETESVGVQSDDIQESPDIVELHDQDYSKFMPWIKVVVQLANTSNFICEHQNYCHPNCYERQRRSCIRLMTSIYKIYDSEAPVEDTEKNIKKDQKDYLKDKLKRRESMFQPSSPTHRRESTPLLDKIKTDANLSAKLKLVMEREKKAEKAKKQKPKDELPIQKYLKIQAQNLTHSPLSVITKAAPILSDDSFIDMIPVAWELLLESDQELAAAAASVFLLASMKVPSSVQDMLCKQLQHEDVNQRIHAVLRFGVLWRFRYQVWPRMEDGASAYFKVPPPSIDFVLPSPTVGLPSLQVVDPPWQPHFKTKVEEVTINQEESKSFVTATTTRRKEQQEMIHRALLAEEDRRRVARENFYMTSIPIMHEAADEPALHHVMDDHEEATLTEEISLAARRMSVAPVNRQSNLQSRNLATGRHGSMFWNGRPTIFEGEEERPEHTHSHHLQVAQHFFPSCVCMAALPIIHLLEDLEVNSDGISVCEVAEKVTWMCLVEDPALFLRTFLEKLTVREQQEELVFLLKKLLHHMPDLPAQTAHCLFNYLIGFIMFYVRSPAEGGQEAIAEALSVLWQVVPSVNGIYFKDLKQTLRKEQCDPMLMVTANVPSAKKLIVHGPDLSSIPSQFPIHEDTQFSQIKQDSLEFFNIPEDQHDSYFLVDTKTNQMHNVDSYVRDFYFFRRNHYPQLSLVHMNPAQASMALQRQAFSQKFAELGKVLFTLAVLQGSQGPQMQNHVSFLHEELFKQPSFPRKALEADFGQYHGEMGKQIYGVDMLHKYAWTKLMMKMFQGMSSTITCSADLPLFLSVINGTLFLHAEDTAMLRLTMATYINAARHFKQVFANNMFLCIMPTILRVYSGHQSNPIVTQTIESTCHKFFILHRNPFVVQMFGSVAPILDLGAGTCTKDCNNVAPQALFRLLLALSDHLPDKLDVMELVDGEKCLSALDFCYIDDPDIFTMIDAVNLCVTVAAYAGDSVRAMQMLTILEAILPFYLNHLKTETDKKDKLQYVREELNIITNLAVSIRALIYSSESMTRNFSGPQRQFESVNASVKATANHSNHSPQGPTIYCDEQSDIRFLHMEEGLARGHSHCHPSSEEDQAEATLKEFRKPRNSLLCVVAGFFSHSVSRVKELKRSLADPTIRAPELLDHKSHNRLADIANTLLKIAPYDPDTMKLKGLQTYMMDILPITDWSQEAVRPALNMVLRRLERLFSKIYKKPVLRRYLDWTAAANLLRGVHSTLVKFTFIAHLPHLKTLINVCLNIILADEGGLSTGDSIHSVQHSDGVQTRIGAPQSFSSAVIKLTAMQMQALGDQYTLEHICGGMSVFPTVEKSINILVNLVLPLVTRMGSGRRDCPKMHQVDINFALSTVLHALSPPNKQTQPSSLIAKTHQLTLAEIGRQQSVVSSPVKNCGAYDMLQNVAFLGLKILIVCFEENLSTQWVRIVTCIQDIGGRLLGGIPLWRFIDFVVTVKTPLFIRLQPFIQFKMMKAVCETEQEYFLQHVVHQKLHGHMPSPKCKGTILVELAAELKHIREECYGITENRQRTSTVQSDYSSRQASFSNTVFVARTSSIHDLIEEQVAARLQPVAPSVPIGGKPIQVGPSQPMVKSLVRQVSQHSSESGHSPALYRKASQRITAHDGSLILEKYTRRLSEQEDENVDVHPPPKTELRRSTSTLTTKAKRPEGKRRSPSVKFQRRDCIIRRGHFAKQQAYSFDSSLRPYSENLFTGCLDNGLAPKPSNANSQTFHEDDVVEGEDTAAKQVLSQSGSISSIQRSDQDGSRDQTAAPTIGDPSSHRLQRQDAKSRKTFKIKRHRSTIKGSIIRSSTVKARTSTGVTSPRQLRSPISLPKAVAGQDSCQGSEPRLETLDRITSQDGERPERVYSSTRTEDIDECTEGDTTTMDQPDGGMQDGQDGAAQGVHDTDVRYREKPKRSSRQRFIPKSKSHDDGSDVHVSGGTARGRIARQGARAVQYHSRSPSISPTRHSSTVHSPTRPQTYLVKSDSTESLNTEENAALLKKEEKSHSQSSLLIFFDGNEDGDQTCV